MLTETQKDAVIEIRDIALRMMLADDDAARAHGIGPMNHDPARILGALRRAGWIDKETSR